MIGPRPPSNESIARVRVRFAETDLMGIVHHASYLGYMEVGRVEWLRRRGVAYASWAERGIHLAVAEVAIKYRAPAHFDEELDIRVTLAEVGAASVRFEYRISNAADEGLRAEGMTRLAYIDDSRTLRRLSPEMVEALSRPETPA